MFVHVQLTLSVDKLTQYKLDLLKKYKPEKNWISLEWDKSFSLNYTSPDSFLKAPTCMKLNNEKIYITDNLQHKLKIYSKEGDFLKSFGQHGKGPSDLLFPYWLEFQKDMVFINSDNGIDIFDQNLKFLKRIKIFLTAKRFFVIKNHVYFGFFGILKGKYPFFIKKDVDGKVIGQVFEDDLEKDDFLKRIKADIFIDSADGKIFAAPMHWNKIYVYNEKLELLKKIRLDYSLLDKIEKWNDIPDFNKKKNSRRIWPCNILAGFKIFEGKLYLFLQLPKLEILVLDTHGNIENHFYNNNDFQFMWWRDFDIQREKEGIVFYILGYSMSDEKPEMQDFNVFRMLPCQKQK